MFQFAHPSIFPLMLFINTQNAQILVEFDTSYLKKSLKKKKMFTLIPISFYLLGCCGVVEDCY